MDEFLYLALLVYSLYTHAFGFVFIYHVFIDWSFSPELMPLSQLEINQDRPIVTPLADIIHAHEFNKYTFDLVLSHPTKYHVPYCLNYLVY